jgi:thymidine phosphorylase
MTVLAQELIRRTRNRKRLSDDEVRELVAGITNGGLSDAQVAAWAMAAFLNGLSREETVTLTLAMRDSGTVLDWPELDAPVLDKHSTGGVGDKVSLVLAPLVAACGGAVPMISGRGLGHTGGTLDKLESIPGYDATPGLERLRAAVGEAGCAIVGQTGDVAPADRRLYALRDATATVECLPLIVASILSKKLAAGLGGLVMDVKGGSGAFLAEPQPLADALVEVAEGAGLPCRALITDMDQVLGRTAGNAVEVREAIAMLRGEDVEPRFRDVTLELTRALLELGGLDPGGVEDALAGGAAADRFARMVVALGGPSDLLEDPNRHLPSAPVVREVEGGPGTIGAIDVRQVGLAVVELGGGRTREDQPVDHAVGLTEVAGIGEDAARLAVVHARDDATAERAAARLRAAITTTGG